MACVECGQESSPKEMYGPKGDRRCEPCAKGIRKRMDPTRTHSLVATSTGTRKTRKQKQTLIAGGLFAVALVVAWYVSDRKPDLVPVDLAPAVAQISPQMRLFGEQAFAPTSGVAAVGSLRAPQTLATLLPRTFAGWERTRATSRRQVRFSLKAKGVRPTSMAEAEYRRGDGVLTLRLVDGGQPSDDDLRRFRAACNTTCAGLSGASYEADGVMRWVRVLVQGRFWIDAMGPMRKDVEAAIASVDVAGLNKR